MQKINQSNQAIKYATNELSTWSSTVVDPSPSIGIPTVNGTSIDLDSNMHAYIAYSANNGGLALLKYATDKNGFWEYESIDSGGHYPSIKIDENGFAHIADGDWLYSLRYITNSSGVWNVTELDQGGPYYVEYVSIARDNDGYLHVSYYSSTDLRYATNESGNWELATVDSQDETGWATSIAVDAFGFCHISYYEQTNNSLKYATNKSGTWVNTYVDQVGAYTWLATNTSIAVDDYGFIHISYYDAALKDLKYATNMTGSWTKTRIDTIGDVGLYSSLALDNNGYVHVSYSGEDALWYAVFPKGYTKDEK